MADLNCAIFQNLSDFAFIVFRPLYYSTCKVFQIIARANAPKETLYLFCDFPRECHGVSCFLLLVTVLVFVMVVIVFRFLLLVLLVSVTVLGCVFGFIVATSATAVITTIFLFVFFIGFLMTMTMTMIVPMIARLRFTRVFFLLGFAMAVTVIVFLL